MANPTPINQAVGAAAVPATPTVLDIGFKYANGVHTPTVLVGFAPDDWDARDAFIKQLSASPSPASTDLHAAIMNLRCDPPGGPANEDRGDKAWVAGYKYGHRDARHAAAELAAAASTSAPAEPTVKVCPLRDAACVEVPPASRCRDCSGKVDHALTTRSFVDHGSAFVIHKRGAPDAAPVGEPDAEWLSRAVDLIAAYRAGAVAPGNPPPHVEQDALREIIAHLKGRP